MSKDLFTKMATPIENKTEAGIIEKSTLLDKFELYMSITKFKGDVGYSLV